MVVIGEPGFPEGQKGKGDALGSSARVDEGDEERKECQYP